MTVHQVNAVSAQPAPPLSRREEAKALFRNAILEAAERVFAERGFHAARIQDVAQQARIAVGTVYNHFEQKDDLLHALLEERTEKMLERLAAQPSDPDAFEARLTARLARLFGYIEEHRSFFLVAIEHGLFAKGPIATDGPAACGKRMRQIERFRAVFRGLVEEGLAAGALAPIETETLLWFLGGILRGFTGGALQRRDHHLSKLAPTVSRLFLLGAAPHAAAPPMKAAPSTRPAPRSPKKPSRPTRRPTE
jgi:AcrR family transcriptional regulator